MSTLAKRPFIDGTKIQYAWNSSSLGTAKECARKYWYIYIQGYTPRGSGMHLRFGRLFQDALDTFDRARLHDDSHDDALDKAVDFLLRSTWDDGTPWDTGDTKKNRETLIRSVVWYIEHYKDDSTQTIFLDKNPALEIKFSLEFPLTAPNGRPYLITGHMDRICKYGDDKFVMDRKTTGGALGPYYFEQYSPDNQMSLYTFASRVLYDVPVAGVIIDAAQILVGSTTFSRGITTRSEAQLAEWMNDTKYWIRLFQSYAEAEYWPMNDTACHKYGGCQFRGVCNKDPQVRDNFLRTDFVINYEASERIIHEQ